MRTFTRQKGMTLIELMVAGALAMVVSYFIMNIMINSNRAAASSDGISQAQETGRFVMSWLAKEARRAGYQPQMDKQDFIAPFQPTCAAGAAPPPANNANCTYEATDEVSDRLAVSWRYDATSTLTRDQQDCTGTDISAIVTDKEILTDVYWVEADTGVDGDAYDDLLRCVTYRENGSIIVNTTPQTIANGVEGMQVLYQVEEPTLDAAGNTVDGKRYINADQVQALGLWDEVKAVRIFVLARAFSGQASTPATRSYVLADADPYTFNNDRTPRYVQSSTIVLYSLRLNDD
ncbi:PilW family protein [Thalassolituus marinus]|uniref:PilW family protein n=1 Tax=Thalassolituus marinus TaxID=671053 RepID=A0ABS7ZNB2_9GAMM|nr:PilW family protein [Thalassolituus marinus]MCA6063193.1 PilW family protein [Thalassolituus marinus]